MIRDEKFREDLFYRFDVFPIEIPPLRERREDIPLLVNYFVAKVSGRMRKQITSIPRQTMEMLTNCPWKGNIRELANLIERAVILTRGDELEVPVTELATSSETNVAIGTASTFRQAESSVIISALESVLWTNRRQRGSSGTAGIEAYHASEQNSTARHRKDELRRVDAFHISAAHSPLAIGEN